LVGKASQQQQGVYPNGESMAYACAPPPPFYQDITTGMVMMMPGNPQSLMLPPHVAWMMQQQHQQQQLQQQHQQQQQQQEYMTQSAWATVMPQFQAMQERAAWMERFAAKCEKNLMVKVASHQATTNVLRAALNDLLADRDRLTVKVQEQSKQLNGLQRRAAAATASPSPTTTTITVGPQEQSPVHRGTHLETAPSAPAVLRAVATVADASSNTDVEVPLEQPPPPPPTVLAVTAVTITMHEQGVGTPPEWLEDSLKERHEALLTTAMELRLTNGRLEAELQSHRKRLVELELELERASSAAASSVVNPAPHTHSTSPALISASSVAAAAMAAATATAVAVDKSATCPCEHFSELTRVQRQVAQQQQSFSKVDQARRQAQTDLKVALREVDMWQVRATTAECKASGSIIYVATSTSHSKRGGGGGKHTVQSLRAEKAAKAEDDSRLAKQQAELHAARIQADVTAMREAETVLREAQIAKADEAACARMLLESPVDPKRVEALVLSPEPKWQEAQCLVAHILQDHMHVTSMYRQDRSLLEASLQRATLSLKQQSPSSLFSSSSRSRVRGIDDSERSERLGRRLERVPGRSRLFREAASPTDADMEQKISECMVLDMLVNKERLCAKLQLDKHERQKHLFVKVLRFNLMMAWRTSSEPMHINTKIALQENVRQMAKLLGTDDTPLLQSTEIHNQSSSQASSTNLLSGDMMNPVAFRVLSRKHDEEEEKESDDESKIQPPPPPIECSSL